MLRNEIYGSRILATLFLHLLFLVTLHYQSEKFANIVEKTFAVIFEIARFPLTDQLVSHAEQVKVKGVWVRQKLKLDGLHDLPMLFQI